MRYDGDLSSLKVGTIHGLCNGILLDHRHRTPLGNAYETLDDLTQLLFLFEHLNEIAGEGSYEDPYLGRWRTRWSAVKGLRGYFDKITEELVDPKALSGSGNRFIRELSAAYSRYEEKPFGKSAKGFLTRARWEHGKAKWGLYLPVFVSESPQCVTLSNFQTVSLWAAHE